MCLDLACDVSVKEFVLETARSIKHAEVLIPTVLCGGRLAVPCYRA
jgi:hypothetical protein